MATILPRCFLNGAAAAATAAAGGAATQGGISNNSGSKKDASTSCRDGMMGQDEYRRERRVGGNRVYQSIGSTGTLPRAWSLGTATGSSGSERSPSPWRGLLVAPLSAMALTKVAYADASLSMEGSQDGAMVTQLEKGEKPELIQRADEQAEKVKPQLRRPSAFHDQFNEVSQLANVHSFEGFRLDVAKAVTPTFFSQHSIFFGSPQFPKGHYQGNFTVIGNGDTSVRASMDADCNASMDANFSLGLPGLLGKLSIHQGKNDLVQGTAMYMGETWAAQVSGGSGPVDVSYNQAVTEQLSVGGQGQFSASQQAVGLLYGFKYNTPGWACLGRYIGGANVLTAQYVRRVVPGRVSLGAEYQAQLGAGSQMSVGAEFVLRQSKMSASLDCNGKVDSSLEVRLGTFPTLPMTFTMSSSLDHSEDKHTFGLALTCGQ